MSGVYSYKTFADFKKGDGSKSAAEPKWLAVAVCSDVSDVSDVSSCPDLPKLPAVRFTSPNRITVKVETKDDKEALAKWLKSKAISTTVKENTVGEFLLEKNKVTSFDRSVAHKVDLVAFEKVMNNLGEDDTCIVTFSDCSVACPVLEKLEGGDDEYFEVKYSKTPSTGEAKEAEIKTWITGNVVNGTSLKLEELKVADCFKVTKGSGASKFTFTKIESTSTTDFWGKYGIFIGIAGAVLCALGFFLSPPGKKLLKGGDAKIAVATNAAGVGFEIPALLFCFTILLSAVAAYNRRYSTLPHRRAAIEFGILGTSREFTASML